MINTLAVIIKNFVDFILQLLLFVFSFKTWKKQYYDNKKESYNKNDFI